MAHELHTHTEMNMQERAHTPEEEDEPIEDERPVELEEERLQKVDDEDGGEEENIVQSGGEDMEKEDDAEETEEFCVTDAPKVDGKCRRFGFVLFVCSSLWVQVWSSETEPG